ncbi:DUF192 domain-containing protein [Candidatus Falkowbacteria bacterium]|uniref:DUF192 domain-containing protein n=1 Tax=Candidatus Buchananbacteria bacterium CG10_big_fil_rev_8_21_14_0_10_33_19 TaxID=1974525 RepID=A0A2H0W419_9BACT|nr:DUF192 domain-containing protein [Candidatus Falkowbacteria bacterium]PIS06017.1 MAG: hypothetical protein COT80_04605 [Candidatus Buchananbacteria bacterium CG10_big_fil_rev_8_21_14_0_10_33_19]
MESQPKKIKVNFRLLSIVFVVTILLFVSLAIIVKNKQALANLQTIDIAGQQIKLRLAKTPSEQQLGLGYVKKMPSNNGMLFVYDDYILPNFWMKNMIIPIDIIWIKDDMVIGYERNLEPQRDNLNLPIYRPKSFVNYVLEVNSGFVDKYSLRIGDIVKISL